MSNSETPSSSFTGNLHLYVQTSTFSSLTNMCVGVNVVRVLERAHHVVTRKQLLQELGLFMLHRLNNELIVAGEVEPGTAGAWVGQLDQGLITDGVLKFRRMQPYLSIK